jgi:DNA-binding FadR family transcriptional regulator/DNA-binding LacI/PurR family transcriptional regulator
MSEAAQAWPGLDRALAYLKSEIEDKPREPGSRVPTVRMLSRAAGVATHTMCEALRQLEKRGLVHTIPKRGTYYQKPPEAPSQASAEEKWEQLSSRIERDILAGHYRPGSALPQQRELQGHYGVSYPTMRKALDILERKGVLFAFKRGFRVAPARKVAGRASLICIGLGDETGRLLTQNPRFQEFVFALQNASALNQIKLNLIGHHPRLGLASLFDRIESLRSQNAVIGFVMWNSHLPLPSFLKALAYVKAFGQPVAIMDEKNNLDFDQPLLNDGPVRAFTIAGISAGRQIARYLLGMGHRQLAFLSSYHREGWSQRRWRGVQEIFRTAGHPENAHLMAIDEPDGLWEPDHCPEPLRPMYDHFRELLADLRTTAKSFPAAHHLNYAQQNNEKLLCDLRMAIQMQHLLDDLSTRQGMTAIIAANDDMALVAMEHLKRKGLQIPTTLSIVGFDDSIRATHFGLTSYNFNLPSMAQRIIAFIRNPGLREFSGKTLVECEGFIMERESAGSI